MANYIGSMLGTIVCLSRNDGEILKAFPEGTTCKMAGFFRINYHVLSIKQGTCEYYFCEVALSDLYKMPIIKYVNKNFAEFRTYPTATITFFSETNYTATITFFFFKDES